MPIANETPAETAAAARGRTQAYATAAVVAGCVAFINLLGAEKALLAIVLGALALRGPLQRAARTRAWVAIGLGALQLVTLIAVLLIFHDKVARLILLLKDLG